MITKIKRTIIGFMIAATPLFAVGSFVLVTPVAAAGGADKCAANFAFPTWYEGLCDDKGNIRSPAGDGTSKDTAANLGGWLTKIALNVVQILLYVVGYVSIGYIIFGGFKYMTQGDNSSGTAAARKTIQNAVIGLVLSIMSVAIVKFVAGTIGG